MPIVPIVTTAVKRFSLHTMGNDKRHGARRHHQAAGRVAQGATRGAGVFVERDGVARGVVAHDDFAHGEGRAAAHD